MKKLVLFLLLSTFASAANHTVKADGTGDYTTISACTAAMAAGDTCTVYGTPSISINTYAENVTITAGTSGNYKTVIVNGSDLVQIIGKVTLNSYDKLIGNCPALQGTITTLTCGFFITSTASGYISTPCVQVNGSSTFFYVQNVTVAFCQGIAINRGSPTHTTHGFIQQNTISYPGTQSSACPSGACNVAVAMPLSCDYCLVEKNDISHTADFDNEYDGSYNVFRGNNFHDNSQAECLKGTHGDQCHIDFVESEPGASSYPTEYTVVEKNTEVNNIGSNSHGFLFQGDTCSGNCFDVILRFNQIAHVGGGGLLDDLGGFYNVHLYNNTWIDMTQNGLTGGITNHWKNASTGGSALNELFYYPSKVTNFNAIACEDTSCTSGFVHGHNLAFCGPFGASSTCPSGSSGLLGYQYGTGAWLSDTGNLLTDPKVTSYSSTGLGNFSLLSTSSARNAGINLTTVNGTVTSSTSLVVNDAHFFQDGHGITGVQGDCVAVTSISNHVCVTAVNYSTNTLTLASAISATNGDPVWIYSISDGTVVLTDTTGPDMGAFPYSAAATIPACAGGFCTFGKFLTSGTFAVGTPAVLCGPPLYTCSTGTTASSPSLGGVVPSLPSLNSTAYAYASPSDFYYPSSGVGNCITRLTVPADGGANTNSMFATWSGGGNDLMWVSDGAGGWYGAVMNSGGGLYYMHIHFDSNGCAQRDNTILTLSPDGGACCGFSMSHATTSLGYHIANTGTKTVITQEVLAGTTTVTVTPSPVFDFNNCPGLDGTLTTQGGNGIMRVAYDDSVFQTTLDFPPGASGQGNAHWVLGYNKSTNSCATYYTGTVSNAENPASGNIWAYCSGNCSRHGSNPAPLALNTACAQPGYGMHDSQLAQNGLYTVISGQCNGTAGSYNIWQLGANNVQRCNSSNTPPIDGSNCGGHDSLGYATVLMNDYPTNSRLLSNISTYTNFGPNLGTDFHGSAQWLGSLADTNPWLVSTVPVLAGCSSGQQYCSEILALRHDGVVKRFAPNYHTYWGTSDLGAISTMLPDGSCVIFQSNMLETLGTDASTGFPRDDIFSICNLQ